MNKPTGRCRILPLCAYHAALLRCPQSDALIVMRIQRVCFARSEICVNLPNASCFSCAWGNQDLSVQKPHCFSCSFLLIAPPEHTHLYRQQIFRTLPTYYITSSKPNPPHHGREGQAIVPRLEQIRIAFGTNASTAAVLQQLSNRFCAKRSLPAS